MKFSDYAVRSAKDVLSELDVDPLTGVSDGDLPVRLTKYGTNLLKQTSLSAWTVFLRQFKSAFIYLLLGAVVITVFLGETTDAIMITIFLLVNAFLGFFQEYRSEKIANLLKRHAAPRAGVIRNGELINVETPSLVVGDIVILETGDKVPADIRILSTNGLAVDETVLTGESVPVYKLSDELKMAPTSHHQASNIAFSGTDVIKGSAKGVVIAVGREAAFGKIAALTGETRKASDFEKGISEFSRFVLKLVALTLVIVFAAHLIIKPGSLNFLDLIVFAVALTISVIPEALPLVTTFSLARGARRLAKRGVIVKRLSAIEDMGGIEVLCSDKTGTLTENKLKVSGIFSSDEENTLYLANLAAAFEKKIRTEPFDIALGEKLSEEQKNLLAKAVKISENPFNPKDKHNAVIVKEGGLEKLIVRGALESIIPLCQLKSDEIKKASDWAVQEGRAGRRTIAVAAASFDSDKTDVSVPESWPELSFSGIISFTDSIKASTKQSVNMAEKLGVGLVIITGDSPEVAGAVAEEIGLIESPNFVVTGDQWAKEDSEGRKNMLASYRVFARVSPEQKFEIINLLREKKMVGFLGEGINDAPALKAAGVSLVVDSASDIAREAADIILLKSDLSVIIDGIREGRQVFANTTKYIKTTLASNFGNFFAVAIASLLVDYLPMLPIQILLLNLLSDTPMISISTDNVDSEELKSPKKYTAKEIISVAIILGIISTIFDFLAFSIFVPFGPDILRTNWFVVSVLTELVLIFSVRTRLPFFKSKAPSWSVLALSFGIIATTLLLPFSDFGQKIFSLTPLSYKNLGVILGITIAYFVCTETAKLLYYRHHKE